MAEPITNVLGTVAIKHCGEYDATMHYEKLNVVTYNGSSYCAKDNTIGNLPTNTTYWDLMAEKGDKGDTGEEGYTPVKGTDYYTTADKNELEATLASDVTSEVSDQLSTLTSATPLVASSTAGMIDTTRIYVNTTDGHWYWYNGENWQDGGVYQSSGLNEDVFGISVSTIDGYYGPTGIFAEASEIVGEKTTNAINVTVGGKINIQQSFEQERFMWVAVCFFNKTTFIERQVLTDGRGTSCNATVTIPSGCDNIKFCFRTFNIDNSYKITDLTNYNMLYNYLSEPVKHPSKYPTAIVGGKGYVTLDTTLLTLTIPEDTIIINRDVNSDPAINYYVINSKQIIDISSASSGSSAINVYFDQNSHVFVVAPYSSYSDDINRYVLFCSIRRSIDTSIYPFTISGNFPYKVDGNVYGIINYENPNIKKVAHRGYNLVAPENTLSAFKLARKMGFRYVETDVSFTSDGIPVLLHDATVDRTSNGTGNINDLSFDYVRTLDFGSWKSAIFTGEKIPSFEEFIILCKNIGLHPYIEIKDTSLYTEEQIASLVDMVNRKGMNGKVTWISFSSLYLNYVKNHDNKARLGYVVNAIDNNVISNINNLKNGNNEVFLDVACTSDISLAITNNIPVEVWTVDSKDTLLALDDYIIGITTDLLLSDEVLYEEYIN